MRRYLAVVAIAVASLVGVGGAAYAAPQGGPISGTCEWSGESISEYNRTKTPAGPGSTTGSSIASCAQAVTGPSSEG